MRPDGDPETGRQKPADLSGSRSCETGTFHRYLKASRFGIEEPCIAAAAGATLPCTDHRTPVTAKAEQPGLQADRGRFSGCANAGRARLVRFVSLWFLVFLVLACFVLPQQAAAQQISLESPPRKDTVGTGKEGESAVITVISSGPFLSAVTVLWTATSDTARVDGPNSDLADGQATNGTVEFEAGGQGPQEETISIAIGLDNRRDGNRAFTMTLSEDPNNPLPAGVSIPPDGATGRVFTTDETRELSIADGSGEEGTPVVFEVSLDESSQTSQPVTVRWTATTRGFVGWATLSGAESDLAPGQVLTDTVTIPADDTSTQFSIATAQDTHNEKRGERFTVTLSEDSVMPFPVDVALARLSSGPMARGAIADPAAQQNVTLVSIEPNTADYEGSPASFLVRLSAASSERVTVRWTATPSGHNPATLSGAESDLAPGEDLTGTVVFEANDTGSKSVRLATVIDMRVEGTETFTVTLSEDTQGGNPLPAGVEISNVATSTTGEIEDQIRMVVGNGPTYTIADAVVTQGGDARFTVTVDPPLQDDGSRQKELFLGYFFPAFSDNFFDDPVRRLPFFAYKNGLPDSALVPFEANSFDIVVPTFDAGSIAAVGDIVLRMIVDTAGGEGGAIQGVATIGTLTGGDAAELSIADDEAAEGSAVVFEISLSAASSEPVTVRWMAVSGTATVDGAGSDLNLASDESLAGMVMFEANDTATKMVSFTTLDDTHVEGEETFTVRLSADDDTPLPDGVSIPSAGEEATGTITEDDMAELSIADGSGAEGAPVVFEVSLSAESVVPVTVRWTATTEGGDGAATLRGAGSDLASGEIPTGTVEFTANDNAVKTVSLATVDDAVVEGSETFTVTLSPDTIGDNLLPDGVSISSAGATATGTITEDDAAELSIADGSGAEGSPVVFEVSLSAASAVPVTVRWTATTAGGDGAATLEDAGSDLASGEDLTGTVEFGTNDNAVKTVSLATVNDAVVEGSETFTVTLSPDDDNPLPDGVRISSAEGGGGDGDDHGG